MKLLSRVRLLATPRTVAHQAPLPMGFSRQEYWSGVPLPSPVEYYSVIKRSEVLIQATTGMNLKTIMLKKKERTITLSERSQT